MSLNDGTYVKVNISGGAVGDYCGFYVSYPFPRINNDKSAMCENCHLPRVMNKTGAETGANGTKVFSHPVGDTMDTTNTRGGTAPLGNILDCDGRAQTTGDGNVTNNVKLATDNTVRCLSCHYPHATDSNSLSVNPR